MKAIVGRLEDQVSTNQIIANDLKSHSCALVRIQATGMLPSQFDLFDSFGLHRTTPPTLVNNLETRDKNTIRFASLREQ